MWSKRRSFDIGLATLGLALLAPVFVVVAIAIWLEDRGPVLFRQRRIGRRGKVFEVLKFRKFSMNANDGPILTLANDDRYSRVGRFLERTKLNELPQLVNVLRGEMAVVGPRPEIEAFEHCYSGRYAQLLDHAPGIFGPSQTAFRNEATMYPPDIDPKTYYETVIFKGKADIDLAYYANASLAGDIYWIWRSLIAVAAKSGGSRPGASPAHSPLQQ